MVVEMEKGRILVQARWLVYYDQIEVIKEIARIKNTSESAVARWLIDKGLKSINSKVVKDDGNKKN